MLILGFLFEIFCVVAIDVVVENLCVEYGVNRIGVDILNARFSWEFYSTGAERNISETEYKIIVSKKEVDSTSKIVVWDFSNKSKESMEIEYNDKT
jgi:hypothetical protein